MTVSLEDAVLILLSIVLVGLNIAWIGLAMEPLARWFSVSEASVQFAGTAVFSLSVFCVVQKVPRNWYRIVVYQAKKQG